MPRLGSAESGTHTFFAWDFKPDFAKIKEDADSAAKFGQIMEKGQFATLYLVEAGGEVVKDNKATVEGILFPAFGTISLASMEADQVKNELAGDTKFHWHYRASVTNFADRASHYFKSGNDTYVDDSWTMASVFKIYSFTVNQIHIRAITFGEIWTQIGGLWGGAILVMSLVFTGSGYVRNHDQKELLVFRYQSAKKKKEALKMVASGVSTTTYAKHPDLSGHGSWLVAGMHTRKNAAVEMAELAREYVASGAKLLLSAGSLAEDVAVPTQAKQSEEIHAINPIL